MTTVVLWIWLSAGGVWAQGVYTLDHCKDQGLAMLQSGEVLRVQCVYAQDA